MNQAHAQPDTAEPERSNVETQTVHLRQLFAMELTIVVMGGKHFEFVNIAFKFSLTKRNLHSTAMSKTAIYRAQNQTSNVNQAVVVFYPVGLATESRTVMMVAMKIQQCAVSFLFLQLHEKKIFTGK